MLVGAWRETLREHHYKQETKSLSYYFPLLKRLVKTSFKIAKGLELSKKSYQVRVIGN
jgi:hypothetical protein